MTSSSLATRRHYWFRPEDCRLEDFRAVVEQATDPADYPYADSVEENVVVYGSRVHEHTVAGAAARGAGRVGAGAARRAGDRRVPRGVPGPVIVDRASEVFTALIAEQKAKGAVAADQFAKPGANDRVWGGLDKFALRAPEVFADYYANDVIAVVSEA